MKGEGVAARESWILLEKVCPLGAAPCSAKCKIWLL